MVGGCDAAVEGAGALSGLRGVLGDVTGDLGVRQFPGRRDRPDVELGAPGERSGGNARSVGSLHPNYDEQRGRGLDHDAALRALSNRLVGILHGCLKTGTLYDEATAWSHRVTVSTAA